MVLNNGYRKGENVKLDATVVRIRCVCWGVGWGDSIVHCVVHGPIFSSSFLFVFRVDVAVSGAVVRNLGGR